MIEVVFASDEASREAHRDLYRFDESSYIIVQGNLLGAIMAVEGPLNRLHVSSGWTGIIRLATWKENPGRGDILFVLRNLGMRPDELLPFREAEVADLFPWLYYGKRLDILRKICVLAKTNAERYVKGRDVRVHCHLTSEEGRRIVASSL